MVVFVVIGEMEHSPSAVCRRRSSKRVSEGAKIIVVFTSLRSSNSWMARTAPGSGLPMNSDCSGGERSTRSYGSSRSKLSSVMSREPWMIRSILIRSGLAVKKMT